MDKIRSIFSLLKKCFQCTHSVFAMLLLWLQQPTAENLSIRNSKN